MEIKDLKEIAKAVLDAQDFRERSFRSSNLAISQEQAAHKATKDPYLAEIVYLLNAVAWNNVQDWANKILGMK